MLHCRKRFNQPRACLSTESEPETNKSFLSSAACEKFPFAGGIERRAGRIAGEITGEILAAKKPRRRKTPNPEPRMPPVLGEGEGEPRRAAIAWSCYTARRSPLLGKPEAGLASRGTYGPEREAFNQEVLQLTMVDQPPAPGPRIKLDRTTRAAPSRPHAIGSRMVMPSRQRVDSCPWVSTGGTGRSM
jgi:hypothetical protein